MCVGANEKCIYEMQKWWTKKFPSSKEGIGRLERHKGSI